MTRISPFLTPGVEVVVPWQATVLPKASTLLKRIVFVCLSYSTADCAEMEDLAHLQASRSGFKGHVTRLYAKIDKLLGEEVDDYSVTSLTTAMEQLNRKMERIAQIDEQILPLIDDPTELEQVVLDREEVRDNILDKIARVQRYIELKTTTQPRATTPPITQPQLVS